MKYFGTDGIRGKAITELSPRIAFRIGQSLKPILNAKLIVIGGDTRQSTSLLGMSIANGALLAGIDVLYADVISTPMLAYYALKRHVIGVMITASHNPYTDNGIKIFYNGLKLTQEIESKIEDFIDHDNIVKSDQYGVFQYTNDVEDTYLKLYENFNLSQLNLKVGYDTANGASFKIAKTVFNQLVKNPMQIGNNPNGLNINKGVGSTHIEAIQSLVSEHQLDIGFAFDGDADRINLVDKHNVYDGDFIIYMVAKYLKLKDLLKNNKVVLTKMSNPGILKALKDLDIDYVLTDVGDKYVLKALMDEDLMVGGEASGHILLRHLIHTGDGLLVAIYLLSIFNELKETPESFTKEITLYPLKTISIKGVNKKVVEHPKVLETINAVKKELDKDYLLLLRPSGTEPLVRLTVSHQDMNKVEKAISRIEQIIKEVS